MQAHSTANFRLQETTNIKMHICLYIYLLSYYTRPIFSMTREFKMSKHMLFYSYAVSSAVSAHTCGCVPAQEKHKQSTNVNSKICACALLTANAILGQQLEDVDATGFFNTSVLSRAAVWSYASLTWCNLVPILLQNA